MEEEELIRTIRSDGESYQRFLIELTQTEARKIVDRITKNGKATKVINGDRYTFEIVYNENGYYYDEPTLFGYNKWDDTFVEIPISRIK